MDNMGDLVALNAHVVHVMDEEPYTVGPGLCGCMVVVCDGICDGEDMLEENEKLRTLVGRLKRCLSNSCSTAKHPDGRGYSEACSQQPMSGECWFLERLEEDMRELGVEEPV